jgi:hypothetical protein
LIALDGRQPIRFITFRARAHGPFDTPDPSPASSANGVLNSSPFFALKTACHHDARGFNSGVHRSLSFAGAMET